MNVADSTQHPRDYPINAAAKTEWLEVETLFRAHCNTVGSVPDDVQLDWAWEKIAQLNAVIALQAKR